MHKQLPTFTSAQWTVTTLLSSITHELLSDTRCSALRMFAYAVTGPGWTQLRSSVLHWLNRRSHRTVVVYVGTDHAITEPDALRSMFNDGLEVRMMRKYNGIYHPKLFWMLGVKDHRVWVGSNNITREGLCNNVEFATLIKSDMPSPDLDRWFHEVNNASEPFDEELVRSYETERRAYAKKRSTAGTFTWSRREEPQIPTTQPTSTRGGGTPHRSQPLTLRRRVHLTDQAGDLIVEIMPRETGIDGKQIQLPVDAAVRFFSLQNRVGDSRQLTFSPVGTTQYRTLTVTLFGNDTARLSIAELDYRDRPCVVVFHPMCRETFAFEIVQQSIFPARYRQLLSLCVNQTRRGSRHWGII